MLALQVALHTCGQVKILKSKFINFAVTERHIYDRFNALIQRHDHLMTMTKLLANAISFILLMQLFVSSVLLCIMGEYCIIYIGFVISNDHVIMIHAETKGSVTCKCHNRVLSSCRVSIYPGDESQRLYYDGEERHGV